MTSSCGFPMALCVLSVCCSGCGTVVILSLYLHVQYIYSEKKLPLHQMLFLTTGVHSTIIYSNTIITALKTDPKPSLLLTLNCRFMLLYAISRLKRLYVCSILKPSMDSIKFVMASDIICLCFYAAFKHITNV